MAKRPSLSGDHLDIEQVTNHFLEVKASLYEYFSPNSDKYETRFLGNTLDQVRQQLETRLDEHDKTCSLMILAALEAFFRIDYAYRILGEVKMTYPKIFARWIKGCLIRKINKFHSNAKFFNHGKHIATL